MGRGGKRAGAGRKPGSKNVLSREIADRAAKEGITPLEVMLKAMRLHVVQNEWDRAAAIAERAAPYMHPRLQAVQHSGPGGGPIQTEDLSARDVLADRLARLAARSSPPAGAGEPD